ncbi:MAG: T9SS type A sorting domain-containing protein [Prevotellaceae bacterium]|jgi:hypothetical protein|nr:T9SS type A sorting domain-containing protein [Prevotellaceae bacterium]
MKRILFVAFLLIFMPLATFAKIVLTYESHGLRSKTVASMQQTTYVAPGDAGENVMWDFSAAKPLNTVAQHETIESLGVQDELLITNASGVKFLYNCTRSTNVYKGFQDSSRTVSFNQPIQKVVYPFSYDSKISGTFDGHSIYHSSNYEYKIAGTYSSEADGYGTLILPTGQALNDVLRVKTVEKYVESSCSDVEIESVKYLWYVAEYRYPVFVTWDIHNTYENQPTTTSQTSFYTLANINQPSSNPIYSDTDEQAAEDTGADITYQVYPNPYNSYFHLTYTLNKPTVVNIALYSLSGSLVKQLVDNRLQNGVQHVVHNVFNNESAGVYYLRLQFGNKLDVIPLMKE